MSTLQFISSRTLTNTGALETLFEGRYGERYCNLTGGPQLDDWTIDWANQMYSVGAEQVKILDAHAGSYSWDVQVQPPLLELDNGTVVDAWGFKHLSWNFSIAKSQAASATFYPPPKLNLPVGPQKATEVKPPSGCKVLWREEFPSSSLGDALEAAEITARRTISRKFLNWPVCVKDGGIQHQLVAKHTNAWSNNPRIEVALVCPNCGDPNG